MRLMLERRLADLETEHQAGRKMLDDLDTKRTHVQSSMLRIEGAIRVLHELLAQDEASASAAIEAPVAAELRPS